MNDSAARLAVLGDTELTALHARMDSYNLADSAILQAHHLVTTEMLKRGLPHGHVDDAWATAVLLVDEVVVSGPDDIESPGDMEKSWGETLVDGGKISVLLTVDGYVLKADPSVSDVHVDSVMGGRRKPKAPIFELSKTIKEEGGKFTVYSEDLGRKFGTYGSRKEAEDRLKQIERFSKAEGFSVPESVQAAARQALEWISDGRAGDGFTSVGRNRAQQLASGGVVSRETLVKMRAYFARHGVDKEAEDWGDKSDPTPGMVAWYAWGGDAGRTWVNRVVVEKRAVPAAIKDLHLNVENRQHAIEDYLYGPLNPEEPGDYWDRLGAMWGVSAEEAATTRCGNCAAFNVKPDITDAIAEVIGDEGDEIVEQADLGYCELLQFKCAATRSCSVWLTGGPNDGYEDDDELTEPLDEPLTALAKFTLPGGATYELSVPLESVGVLEPVLKHPGHGDEKVHGGGGGGSELPDEGRKLIKGNLSKGNLVESYGRSYDDGKASKAFGSDHVKGTVARHAAERDELTARYGGQPRSFATETAAFNVASHQGFIDGALGRKAQFPRQHGFSQLMGGLLGGGLASGAIKSAEPVLKHPGHPDQKVHGGLGGGLGRDVANSIIERTRANGGLSVSMVDGSEPPGGYMVARTNGVKPAIVDADEFYDPQRGPKALGSFLKSNKKQLTGGDYLGVWHDKDSGKVFLDVSQNIKNRGVAERRGRERDQISIWDVTRGMEIATGGTGEISKSDSGDQIAGFVEDDGRGDRRLRGGDLDEVQFSVEKHGSHDQSSHGRKGAGNGSFSATYSKTVQAKIDSKPDVIVFSYDPKNPAATQKLTRGVDSAWHHIVADPASPGGYRLTPERQKVWDAEISAHLAGVPTGRENPVFVMMGGGGGSGKGTLLDSGKLSGAIPDGGMGKGEHVKIDVDEIKGHFPEYGKMVDARKKTEVAAYVHEESSMLGKIIQDRAIGNNSHIVLDGTGDAGVDSLRAKLSGPKEAGYRLVGEYVTAPIRTGAREGDERGAWERNINRAATSPRGLVPAQALLTAHVSVSRIVPDIAGDFDEFRLRDTGSGRDGKVIATATRGGKIKVQDSVAYTEFREKANTTLTAEEMMADVTRSDRRRINSATGG